ncbi:glutathione S-transferase [Terrihabitans soli]|uniref:Glutathione S-transferase n=1 Tax=Terrihabitans soli TaxID=708113 RepID=A0A6S6QT60_9HYPH|nr:glutathione S-transferase family protein [Terrihabitans soli]BCJ91147.1 glutathione S-transferase [Terrihabitans soli]
MSFTLILGNKAYSSWSLRPWIALKQAGIPFEEKVIPIYMDGSEEAIRRYSPAGKVPILKDGDLTVWDSLAILEYVAEKHPKLWPADPKARAVARSISAEMHSGFVPLRKLCTMNLRRHYPGFELNDEVRDNIQRIDTIFAETRAQYGKNGPFLFGEWTAADAMYAPVVTRFKTYDVKLSAPSQAYCETVLATPGMKEWYAAAEAEPWTLPQYEY